MFKNHLRYAWRTLTRHTGYTTINMLGLCLGLCACITIYTITHYEFSFDDFHPDKARLYRIGGKLAENINSQFPSELYTENIPPPAPGHIRADIPGIELVAPYFRYDDTTIIATIDYLHIFPHVWLAGNPATALSEPNAIVLTQSQALKHFGRRPPEEYVNRLLTIDDSVHLHVTGILNDWTGNTDFPHTQFISFSSILAGPLKNRFHTDNWMPGPNNPWNRTLIKLRPNANLEQTKTQLAAIFPRYSSIGELHNIINFQLVLQPLADVHFNKAFSHDGLRKAHLPALYGLMGAAAFILLLAIVNFINLSTAQSLRRAKEVGVRKILGGSKTQLMLRFLTETALITGFAAILALALTQPLLAAFRSYIPDGVSFHPLEPQTLTFIIGIVLATTLFAGLYPARLLAAQAPVLHHVNPLNNRRSFVRKALIVFQFTISGIFIIGSITANHQLHYMLDADMGFAANAVVTINHFGGSPDDLHRFAEKVRSIPGISDLTLQSYAPAGTATIEQPIRLDKKETSDMFVRLQGGDQEFLHFYHLKLLAGQNLPAGDSLNGFLINATYCRTLGFTHPADAIGHSLSINGQPSWPIDGVIADYHENSLHDAIIPLVLGHFTNFENSLAIRLPQAPSSAGLRQTIAKLESIWRSVIPVEPFDYSFLDESIAKLYEDDRRLSWLVGAATAVTIFISCMGLIGLATFMAEQRKKEIAIRKVLGAGITSITTLLSRDFLALVGVSLLIAGPIAGLALHRWLETYAFRVVVSAWIFILAALTLLLITGLTISLRVIGAARQNPVDNLRSE